MNTDERKTRRGEHNLHKAMQILVDSYQRIKNSLLQLNQNTHVNWNFQIIYDYHFLINLSLTL